MLVPQSFVGIAGNNCCIACFRAGSHAETDLYTQVRELENISE
jgi:hypothetical protein